MPNYCYNQTVVEGERNKVLQFHEGITTDGRIEICRSLLPLPNWAYETTINMWGSKWGDFEHEIEDQPGNYAYQTAWGPIDNGLRIISGMFPDLWFTTRWYEEDYHYGIFVCQAGLMAERGGTRLELPDGTDEQMDNDDWWENRWQTLRDTAFAQQM